MRQRHLHPKYGVDGKKKVLSSSWQDHSQRLIGKLQLKWANEISFFFFKCWHVVTGEAQESRKKKSEIGWPRSRVIVLVNYQNKLMKISLGHRKKSLSASTSRGNIYLSQWIYLKSPIRSGSRWRHYEASESYIAPT